MSEKKSEVARTKVRSEDGKFVKGQSGNPNGRPKKEKSTDLPKDWKEKVDGKAVKALKLLLETAKDRYEAKQLAKELAPYQNPKLSNIEATTTENRNIEIKWIPFDAIEESKVIEQVIDDK